MINRNGLSEVVSTVLIVLITIAAVAFVANLAIPFVRNNLQSSTECLSSQGYFTFDDTQGYDCYDQNGLYGFSVQAGNGGETSASDQVNGQPESADFNKDWVLSSNEINNFTRLYNYVSGSVRTGQYHCDSTTVDGYAPGPGNTISCPSYSADLDQSWSISLNEYNMVLAIYNNPGTSGKYHLVAPNSTYPDGYAPGPGNTSSSNASIGNNITGFAVVFGSSSDSATVRIFDGNSSAIPSTPVGGVRMLNSTLPKIYVSKPGEVQTYVYNAGSTKYSQIDIYPIIQSGRICDKSGTITLNLCKGVTLTP